MSSVSEVTFGAKLRNAQDLVQILGQFTNYVPARPSEGIVELKALCDSIVITNNNVTNSLLNYNTATKTRTNLFKNDADGLIKRLSPIRKYVDALYGKDSIQSKQVAAIINRIRSSKATVVAATALTEEYKISQSEQSFGSLTQAFTDLIITLETFSNYNPVAAHLTIPNLKIFITQITQINNDVIGYLTSLRFARAQRTDLYKDLHDRALRIKSFTSANYGNTSNEYKMIKGLKI